MKKRKRYSVKVTKPGSFYIGLTLFIGIAAVNTGNSVLYLVVSIMLGVMAISGMTSFVNLLGLNIDIEFPEEIYAKSKTALKVRIKNRKPIPSFLLELGFKEDTACLLQYLPGKSELKLNVWGFFEERGWQEVGELLCFSYFPVGFFSRSFLKRIKTKVLVYPEPLRWSVEYVVEKTLKGISFQFNSDEEEFKGLKEYVPGESIRLIHWVTSAKVGKLMVKQYGQKADPEFWLIMPEKIKGKELEETLGRFTYACNYLIASGVSVGFKSSKVLILPGKDNETRKRILTTLALYEG